MNESHHPTSFIPPEIADLSVLFPAYQISHLISTHRMGAVYCATQKSLDRTVAIKILPRELSADHAFREGFVAEAKAMARLNHANLIGVYDFGEVDDMLFIIMEYVPGKSIYHSAHGRAIDPQETIRLISSICHGLAHAHENGIVHRDIKPSNILLDLDAQPKIGDFGIARPLGPIADEGNDTLSTLHYAAPELLQAPYIASPKSDLYSLGVMLHELLTGCLPTQDRRPASSIVHCDVRLDAIIRRATKPDAALRYANANEMANDLLAITQSRLLAPAPYVAPDIQAPSSPVNDPSTSPRSVPDRSRVRIVETEAKSSAFATIFKLLLAVGIGVFTYNYYQKISKPRTIIIREPAADTRQIAKNEPTRGAQPAASRSSSSIQQETPSDQSSRREIEPASPIEPGESPYKYPDADNKPKTELDTFYERARKIMKTRAASILTEHENRQRAIFNRYQDRVKSEIRKVKGIKARNDLQDQWDTFFENCRQDHYALPENPDPQIASVMDIDSAHMEAQQALRDQKNALGESLTQMSSTYIFGLEKQMERYKAANHLTSAALVQKEIQIVRSSKSYFADLMMK